MVRCDGHEWSWCGCWSNSNGQPVSCFLPTHLDIASPSGLWIHSSPLGRNSSGTLNSFLKLSKIKATNDPQSWSPLPPDAHFGCTGAASHFIICGWPPPTPPSLSYKASFHDDDEEDDDNWCLPLVLMIVMITRNVWQTWAQCSQPMVMVIDDDHYIMIINQIWGDCSQLQPKQN